MCFNVIKDKRLVLAYLTQDCTGEILIVRVLSIRNNKSKSIKNIN